MVWDFAETNPFNPEGASWVSGIEDVPAGLRDADFSNSGGVLRGSATALPWPNASFDAVITDPPYYDNVSYSNLSDFFFVWLKRTVGHLYVEHFSTETTPKKKEIIAAFYRHGGDKAKSRQAYETMMAESFAEASRILKPGGHMVVVYAHKTTLGWATLVDSLREAGFTVFEAWPLSTEKPGRLLAQRTAALASSIFLVARKRDLPAASRGSAAQAGSGIGTVDGPTRFYVLWRYTYKAAEMDAGEAIVFTYGQNVELDGPSGLSMGSRALVEKKKGKYRLRDFTERGDNEKLGFPADDGTPAPLIDALHRILWLIENEPRNLNHFLDEARPDRERLRLVAQALAGTALEGRRDEGAADHLVTTTATEQAALKKLVANWRVLIDQRLAASEGTLFDPRRR